MNRSDDDSDAFAASWQSLAPRAPATLLPRVLAQVAAAAQQRQQRRRRILGVASLGALAAALLLALWSRPPAPTRRDRDAAASTWRLATASGPVQGAQVGQPLGQPLVLDRGATALLKRADGATCRLTGAATLTAQDDALALGRGTAQLDRQGANADLWIDTPVARVSATSKDAQVELALYQGGTMERQTLTIAKGGLAAVAALGAALLAVHVVHGEARVDHRAAAAPAVTLAAGDHALLTPGHAPLRWRRAEPAVAQTHVPAAGATRQALAPNAPAAQGPAAVPTNTPAPSMPPAAAATGTPGSLDKEAIRAGIRSVLPAIKTCYEAALPEHPALGGKLLVEFTIRAQEGRGVVEESEVLPDSDTSLLDVPSTGLCILQALSSAEFPAPQGGNLVTVRYPFVLQTGH